MKRRYNWMVFGKGKSSIVIIHLNKPQEQGIGGFVRSGMFKDLPIVIDSLPENERDYDFACLAAAKNGVASRVKMTLDTFYGIKRNDPIARFSLLHEVGHHKNGDLNNETFISGRYDENRITAVRQGTVLDSELKADAFACSYLGLDYSIKALEGLKKLGDETELGQLFIKEIDLREKQLKQVMIHSAERIGISARQVFKKCAEN